MGGNLVGNDTSLNIITVGKSQMFLWSDIAKHGSSKSGNIGSTDGRGNVIISRCNICCKRAKSVERCFVTPFKLVSHIFRNFVEWNMSRTFIHDLNILFPSTFGEFTLSLEFSELGLVVGIVNRSRTETITNGEGNIIFGTNVENLIPMFVGKVLLVVEDIPLGMDGSTTADDACHTVNGCGNVSEKNTSMDGEVINTLLSLLDQGLTEDVPIQIFSNPVDLFQGLVNRDGSYGNSRVTHDPFTCLVDVFSGRQIHESISTPESGPLEFFNFLFNT
mmetsp:Transcript_3529/g.5111  ORF Transcript_3529/g.5111 Transcript_3529/m.5111 type:complete len:276 (-) Transcript_3529:692-1519(-)